MKNYINKLLVIWALLLLSTSCEKDVLLTTLEKVSFSGAVEASPSTILLTSQNANQTVVTISWPAIQYPVNAPVTYALQFDVVKDTIGATAWEKSVRIEAGEDVLSKSLLGTDLNKMAIKLGLPIDIKGKIVVRVESYLDRKIFSKAIALDVTPFAKPIVFGAIYMPGSYQDWDINTAAALNAIDSGIYQGYVTFPATKGLGFKFTNQRNWSQFYGADANGNILDGSDTDFKIAAVGTYQMTVNLNTLKWAAVPYSWGIVGDATSGGWNTSTPMAYDHINKVWKITANLVPGNIKFRLNNSWTINYGQKNNTEGIAYLDNQGAHYVGVAGTYEITFTIQEKDPTTGVYPATGTYTVNKI